MDMPFVSLVIPVYNGEKTLEKCLESVRNQDYPRGRYELIVIDDGSTDKTGDIARRLADRVMVHPRNAGLCCARHSGITATIGAIIVNLDSDELIRPDTVTKIVNYFAGHPEVDALTGLFSKEHPNPDFFSQYKNLYMNYIFNKLPERVTFLSGGINALRKEVAQLYISNSNIGEDTMFGQELMLRGKRVVFLRDFEVIHLKKYTPTSFIKNDFLVPFNWAKIFLKYRGWKQLGKNKTGFAHSPKRQLASVVLAPLIFILSIGDIGLATLLFLIWFSLNYSFLSFLKKEKGLFFGLLAFFVTFMDNIIMAMGIMFGLFSYIWPQRKIKR
jgi:glycosyltransferase involved in cell wall biosynthesis